MSEVLITLKDGSSYVAPAANLHNIKRNHGDEFSSAIPVSTTIQKAEAKAEVKAEEKKEEPKTEAKTAAKKGGRK